MACPGGGSGLRALAGAARQVAPCHHAAAVSHHAILAAGNGQRATLAAGNKKPASVGRGAGSCRSGDGRLPQGQPDRDHLILVSL